MGQKISICSIQYLYPFIPHLNIDSVNAFYYLSYDIESWPNAFPSCFQIVYRYCTENLRLDKLNVWSCHALTYRIILSSPPLNIFCLLQSNTADFIFPLWPVRSCGSKWDDERTRKYLGQFNERTWMEFSFESSFMITYLNQYYSGQIILKLSHCFRSEVVYNPRI
jgi:hypothetical protein